MSSGTSYNGWPANSDKSAIGVVSNEWFPGGAKSGDVTTVLGYVARELNSRVEPLVAGWGWGYTYKTNANNPSQLSCHASGTALDFNAPDHPNGSSGTFTDAQVGVIYQILDECQGAVGWLQGYDEMHFEIQVSASDLASVAASLGGGGGGTPPTPPTPGDDSMSQQDVDNLAEILTGGRLQILVADDSPSGAVFAYGPGVFVHVTDGEQLAVGQDLGYLSSNWQHTNRRGLDVMSALALQPNVTTPSNIATP